MYTAKLKQEKYLIEFLAEKQTKNTEIMKNTDDKFIIGFLKFLLFMFIFALTGLTLSVCFYGELTSGQRVFIGIVFSFFVTRSILNQQELENQIFELKQLIEKQNEK
jgi:cobalamin biosynthesis protein CobD/CbiB